MLRVRYALYTQWDSCEKRDLGDSQTGWRYLLCHFFFFWISQARGEYCLFPLLPLYGCTWKNKTMQDNLEGKCVLKLFSGTNFMHLVSPSCSQFSFNLWIFFKNGRSERNGYNQPQSAGITEHKISPCNLTARWLFFCNLIYLGLRDVGCSDWGFQEIYSLTANVLKKTCVSAARDASASREKTLQCDEVYSEWCVFVKHSCLKVRPCTETGISFGLWQLSQ